MAFPPKDIPASELFLKLIERPQPSVVVEFPSVTTEGKPVDKIRILALLGEQHEAAVFRARRYLKEKRQMTDADLATEWGQNILGDAKARECIAMACCMVDPIPGTEDTSPVYPALFREGAEVNKLRADEITALFGAFLMVQQRFGPYERTMTETEVNAWIRRLEEGASALPLSLLSSHQHGELTLSLARRASCLSRLLSSLRQNSAPSLESIPEDWVTDTTWSGEPAVTDTPSSDEDRAITMEEAMNAARAVIGSKQ